MSTGNELQLYRVIFCKRPVAPSLHSLMDTLRVQRVLALGRRLVGADPLETTRPRRTKAEDCWLG